LLKKLQPKSKNTHVNICNLVVVKGLVANADRKSAQLIRVTAATADINYGLVDLTWQIVDNDGTVHEPFATANIVYGNPTAWLSSWSPMAHLVHGRIEALERLAAEGKANRFSRNMAYNIFGANLVDYADKYRGMHSVVMHELEGFADVQLTTKETGVWTVAPYFIDSVAHLAGFIMNCSDAMDTKKNYCVTPGWRSMRFAKPLVAGAKYRSYVKMIPTAEDPTAYFGDVYILQDNVIVGLVEGIEFHSYPRILLTRFFSSPDKTANIEGKQQQATRQQTTTAATLPQSPPITVKKDINVAAISVPAPSPASAPAALEAESAPAESNTKATAGDSVADRAFQLIANEAGLEISDLEDDASFNHLGVDSLMSLVIVEKFRLELDVKVSGSLFLDYPTIGDLRKWLDEYYG
jgi:monodictyphenone polyketide synthase